MCSKRIGLIKELSSNRGRRRYAKSEESVERILESAARLFRERNYPDVTMADIAVAAGMTKGGLYHHFPTKEELYLSMMEGYLRRQGRLLREAAAKGSNCRESLRLLTVRFLTQPRAECQLMRLVRRDVNVFQGPSRSRLIRSYQSALPELEEEIIRRGMQTGEVPEGDARLLSWLHVAMVEVALGDDASRVAGSAERLADYTLDIFFDGLYGQAQASKTRRAMRSHIS